MDEHWMARALDEAREAADRGDVPVGAVLVRGDVAVATGHNRREQDVDPTGHAEMVVLRAGAAAIGSWRLTDCTLYVTLEPCAMCAGAVVLSRLGRLVYGAVDVKAGAVDSLYTLLRDPRLNHTVPTAAGVLAEDCGLLLRDFFAARRSGSASG